MTARPGTRPVTCKTHGSTYIVTVTAGRAQLACGCTITAKRST